MQLLGLGSNITQRAAGLDPTASEGKACDLVSKLIAPQNAGAPPAARRSTGSVPQTPNYALGLRSAFELPEAGASRRCCFTPGWTQRRAPRPGGHWTEPRAPAHAWPSQIDVFVEYASKTHLWAHPPLCPSHVFIVDGRLKKPQNDCPTF